jgi:hypothetical protein
VYSGRIPSLSLDEDGRLHLQNNCDPEHHDIKALASVATGRVDCTSNFRGVKLKITQFIQRNQTRCNSVSKFAISYLYEAQHVSGDTPLIIRSLKLH